MDFGQSRILWLRVTNSTMPSAGSLLRAMEGQAAIGSVLFLAKKGDAGGEEAIRFLEAQGVSVTSAFGEWGDPLPEAAQAWAGDLIVSYLSRWIVPPFLLERASRAAINFHPAPPEYPGIGCINFALYEGAPTYGATCHHMAPRVDTGNLIATKRFPVFPGDTVETLLRRTYAFQLVLFYEVMGFLLQGKPLPTSQETWTRLPFTRKEFTELGKITPAMTKEEVSRRVRATSYGKWGPTVELSGHTFQFQGDRSAP